MAGAAGGGKERPNLLGQPFQGPMEGHEPLIPQGFHHYDLHAWLFKDNPQGMFSPDQPECVLRRRGLFAARNVDENGAGEIAGLELFRFFFQMRNSSNVLFCRNSGRKTGSHFSWNCSSSTAPVRNGF